MNNVERYKAEVDLIKPSEKLLSDIESMSKTKRPKKVNYKKIAAIAAAFLVVTVSAAALTPALRGAKMENSAADNISLQSAYGTEYKYTAEEYSMDDGLGEKYTVPGEMTTSTSGTATSVTVVSQRKLIKDAFIDTQTKDFDSFFNTLNTKTAEFGGYTESSDINSSSLDGNRFATVTLRIPSEKLDSFLDSVSSLSTVTSSRVNVRDVTSTYIDVESRIKALETEYSTLLSLLEKAESLVDTLEIQRRLTDVSANLESYKSQFNTLKEEIALSSVTIDVVEVKREQSVNSDSFLDEIRTGISDNFYSVMQGLREFVIWLISSLPFLLLFIIPVAIIVIVIKVIRRKRMK